MPVYAYLILDSGFLVWFLPFVLTGWSRKSPARRDARARWGIGLQTVGYATLWLGPFWSRPLPHWRVAAEVLFLALGCLLSWTSAGTLGRHLRLDAALDTDHRLIRAGAYRFVRHPIYASMLCMLLANGAMVATPLRFALGLAFFLAGTEIRVHVEDALLAERFGEEFQQYRRSTPAYVPLVR